MSITSIHHSRYSYYDNHASAGSGSTSDLENLLNSQVKTNSKASSSSGSSSSDKLQKIGARVKELKKAGKSDSEIKTTIEKEFGKPTQSDLQTLQSQLKKLSGTSSSQGAGGIDLSQLLGSRVSTSNSDILSLLDSNDSSSS